MCGFVISPLYFQGLAGSLLGVHGRILSNKVEVAECFPEYFCNITDSLDIDPPFKEVPEQISVQQMVLER